MRSAIILSTLFTVTLAQNAASTLSVPVIGWSSDPDSGENTQLYASVVSVNAQATTLQIACASTVDCGLFPKETIVYGASTYNIDMSDPNTDFTATMDCVLGSPWIVCKETAGGSEANFPGSSTTSYEASSLTQVPVSITAGAEKLNGVEAAATGAVSSQAAVSTGAGAKSASPSVTPGARSGSVSGSAPASQTSSGAAMASTGAAAAKGRALVGEFAGFAVGVFGALLL